MLTLHSYGKESLAGSRLMMAHFLPSRFKYCCNPLQYVVFPLPGGPITHCPKGMCLKRRAVVLSLTARTCSAAELQLSAPRQAARQDFGPLCGLSQAAARASEADTHDFLKRESWLFFNSAQVLPEGTGQISPAISPNGEARSCYKGPAQVSSKLVLACVPDVGWTLRFTSPSNSSSTS